MKPTSDAIAIAVLAAFLLFVAFNLQAGWVFGVDSLLLGLLVVGWLSARVSLRGVTVQRQMAPEVFEGEQVAVTLTVAVPRGRRYFLELHDAVPGLTAAVSVVPFSDARHPSIVTYQTVAKHRGIHQVDMVEVRSAGLAGLFTSRRRLEARSTLTVFPRYWPVADFPVPGSTGTDPAPLPLPTREGIDLAGVREFRDGDSLRHVHWRSTARRGTLVVREFERAVHPPVALLLDTSATAYGSAGGVEAFEDSVRAAASIAFAVTQAGRDVHLVAASGHTPLTAVAGWRQTLHMLARVQPDGRLSLSEVYAALPAGTGVVVCSPSADTVAMLAHKGIPLSAVLVDVASYAASAPSVSSAVSSRPVPTREGEGRTRGDATAAGETLLEALGVPAAVLRFGEEGGAWARSFDR
jgi:uncharacterized protein (DUF58 family)